MDELKRELKQLIITSCALQDLTHDQILDDQPLFQEGLGLDSIDALELGVALQRRYGLTLAAESEETRRHFASVATLARFVAASRTK